MYLLKTSRNKFISAKTKSLNYCKTNALKFNSFKEAFVFFNNNQLKITNLFLVNFNNTDKILFHFKKSMQTNLELKKYLEEKIKSLEEQYKNSPSNSTISSDYILGQINSYYDILKLINTINTFKILDIKNNKNNKLH